MDENNKIVVLFLGKKYDDVVLSCVNHKSILNKLLISINNVIQYSFGVLYF